MPATAKKAPARKKPQDHKPKAADAATYSFEWNGTTYSLPPAETAVDKVSGKVFRDSVMDGEAGQLRLGFAMLENVEADPAALDALYEMPAPDMLDHIAAWMDVRSDETAATVGESSRSLT